MCRWGKNPLSAPIMRTILLPVACSPQPQTHPLDTAPIPANVRILEEPCSPLGAMMCGAVSILSGETAVERRSACIVYVEPNGKRVEQCGSLPLSQPLTQSVTTMTLGLELNSSTSKSCEILIEARL